MPDFYAYPFQANDKQNPGMTLRDYFAAQALAAICSDMHLVAKIGSAEGVASRAYNVADAMLEERDK